SSSRLCSRSLLLPPPRPTLFPYTTLFRSARQHEHVRVRNITPPRETFRDAELGSVFTDQRTEVEGRRCSGVGRKSAVGRVGGQRSEEHTSELQSRENLVCRLLLEKKKDKV